MGGGRRDGYEREGDEAPANFVAGAVLSAGFSVLASAVGGLCVGIALDKRGGGTHFAPAGLLVGLLVGFHRVYILFRQIAKRKGRRPLP